MKFVHKKIEKNIEFESGKINQFICMMVLNVKFTYIIAMSHILF